MLPLMYLLFTTVSDSDENGHKQEQTFFSFLYLCYFCALGFCITLDHFEIMGLFASYIFNVFG